MNKYFKILCIYLLNTNNISYTMEDMQNNIVSDNNYKVIQNNNDYIKYLEEENSKLAETVEQLSIKFDELQKLCLNQMQIDNAKKELNYLIKIKQNGIFEYISISIFLYSSYIINYMNKSWLQNNEFVYTKKSTIKNKYEHACDKVDTIKELLQKEKNGIIQKLIDDKKIYLDTNDKNKYYITFDSIPNLLYYNEKLSIYINDYCTQYLPKFKYLENYVSEVIENINIIYKNNKNIKIKQSSKINKLELLLNDIKDLHNCIENINKSYDNIRNKLLAIQKVSEEFIEKLKNSLTENIQKKLKTENIKKQLNAIFDNMFENAYGHDCWRDEFNKLKEYLSIPENLYTNIESINTEEKIIDKDEKLESENKENMLINQINPYIDNLYKELNTFNEEMNTEIIQQLVNTFNVDKKYEKLYEKYDELTQILKEIIDSNNC